MNETKDDLKREKVRIVPISNIEDFPDHPFQVKDDESMDELVEKMNSTELQEQVLKLIDDVYAKLLTTDKSNKESEVDE